MATLKKIKRQGLLKLSLPLFPFGRLWKKKPTNRLEEIVSGLYKKSWVVRVDTKSLSEEKIEFSILGFDDVRRERFSATACISQSLIQDRDCDAVGIIEHLVLAEVNTTRHKI